MTRQAVLRRDDISEFISNLYDGDLHAKRVLSLANATLGVLTSASLAIHAVGQGLAQATGRLSKHGVKQVERLLSNDGIDVETFFSHGVPYMVGAGVSLKLIDVSEHSPDGEARHWSDRTPWRDTIVREVSMRTRSVGSARASVE